MAEPQSEPVHPYDPSTFSGPAMREKRDIPDGLWLRCPDCEGILYRKTVVENLQVCPECGNHFRVGAWERIEQLVDPDSFEELFGDIAPADPLEFEWRGQKYSEYVGRYQKKAGTTEALLTGVAYIKGRRVCLG
ncbi:MAG: acetyl-CoA carboxylase carboxyl transferase subunit beta, partial [Planctomycetota bacterium]